VQAIDQMKPTISRAMATLTTWRSCHARSADDIERRAEPALSPDVANDFWQRLDTIDLVTADARFHSVSPGAFNQRAPGVGVAGLGNAAASDGVTTRSLARNQAKIGHELAWVREACEVADFRDQHHGIDQAIPASLQRVNDGA